jgi:formate hydrogenlyase subunit 3/multisubunit Na+/H+ antiporter MnhD subunit
MNRLLAIIALLSIAGVAAAAGAGSSTTIGQAARNVNEILMGLTGIIEAVFYIAGAAVLCSAAMKYRIHRQTPQQVPISTVITEVVLAIVLLLVPTVTKLANDHLFQEGDAVKAQGSGSQAVNQGATGRSSSSIAPVRPKR